MKPEGRRGLDRLFAAWGHSCSGLRDVWQREEAFRLEVACLALGTPVAIFLASSVSQFLLLIGSVLALMVVEILNSAIEAVVDRIGLERHELSRVAKDLASAAVLLTALFPVVTWILVILSAFDLIAL